jgi:osmotically-inducible protein OsmY
MRRSSPSPGTSPVPTPCGTKGYRGSDERITEEVCERLTAHGALDAREIEVRVEEGEVTLEGTVETSREKRLAVVVMKANYRPMWLSWRP